MVRGALVLENETFLTWLLQKSGMILFSMCLSCLVFLPFPFEITQFSCIDVAFQSLSRNFWKLSNARHKFYFCLPGRKIFFISLLKTS